jgi:hypothetical protein
MTGEPDDEREARGGEAPAIINLPDQSQPEPSPTPRPPGKHTGSMKGRHFGPRPVADPQSAFMPAWRTTSAMRAQVLAEIEAAGLTYSAFMRAKFLAVTPRPRDRRHSPEDAAVGRIMGALGRSGNNLNQLLREVNRYDFRGIPELIEMHAAMKAAHAEHHALVAAIKAELGV